MTASELVEEYLYNRDGGYSDDLHRPALQTFATYIVDVVIPRERVDATKHVPHLSVDWCEENEEEAVY